MRSCSTKKLLQDTWRNYNVIISFRNIAPPISDPNKLEELPKIYPDVFTDYCYRTNLAISTMTSVVVDPLGYSLPCCAICRLRAEANKCLYTFLEIGHVNDIGMLTAWSSKSYNRLEHGKLLGLRVSVVDVQLVNKG